MAGPCLPLAKNSPCFDLCTWHLQQHHAATARSYCRLSWFSAQNDDIIGISWGKWGHHMDWKSGKNHYIIGYNVVNMVLPMFMKPSPSSPMKLAIPPNWHQVGWYLVPPLANPTGILTSLAAISILPQGQVSSRHVHSATVQSGKRMQKADPINFSTTLFT
jgi:hypothetical protein